MNLLRFVLLLVALTSSAPSQLHAHALQPGFLSVSPLAGDSYRVFWRKPDMQGRPMAIDVRLPDICDPSIGPEPQNDGRAWVSSWVSTCPGGLTGGEITIIGLEAQQNDTFPCCRSSCGSPRREARGYGRLAVG